MSSRKSPASKNPSPTSRSKKGTPKAVVRGLSHKQFGFELESVVLNATMDSKPEEMTAKVSRHPLKAKCSLIFDQESFEDWSKSHLEPWMSQRLNSRRMELTTWTWKEGPAFLVYVDLNSPRTTPLPPNGLSPFHRGRELGAQLVTASQDLGVSELEFEWIGFPKESKHAIEAKRFLEGFFVGMELGHYRFKSAYQGPLTSIPKMNIPQTPSLDLENNAKVAVATNLARHLVNLPPNILNPVSYVEFIEDLFAKSHHVTLEVWDHKRLIQEGLNLLCGVGGASQYPPALVHIRYRGPRSEGSHEAARTKHRHSEEKGLEKKSEAQGPIGPVVFVAKGITFDSGGLNIKDSGGMRLMKKDMGGSATALALAYWLEKSQLPIDCNFYLALAENAVGSRSFRPGDIITSRSGITVEIDNTDAEGRLVMADAIDVALEQNPKPKLLINLSTLTGAMRVALGTRVAGYFTTALNVPGLLENAAFQMGEPMWNMPLFQEYRSHLKSHVADLANSGPQRFGGAISAALFLQRFTKGVPWLHIDHYAWTESLGAGANEPGGTGQLVQLFSQFLVDFSETH